MTRPHPATRTRRAAPIVAIGAAVLGGLYGGFFACGRHSWQPAVIYAVVALPTIVAVLWAPRSSGYGRRIGFVLLVTATVFLAEHLGGTFYPGPPSSIRAFLASFVRGPC